MTDTTTVHHPSCVQYGIHKGPCVVQRRDGTLAFVTSAQPTEADCTCMMLHGPDPEMHDDACPFGARQTKPMNVNPHGHAYDVARLRGRPLWRRASADAQLISEAADEIERLRNELAARRAPS